MTSLLPDGGPISNLCIVLFLPEDTKPGYVLEIVRKFEKAGGVGVPGKGQTIDIVGTNIMGVTATKREDNAR